MRHINACKKLLIVDTDIKLHSSEQSFHLSIPDGMYQKIINKNAKFDHTHWTAKAKDTYWGQQDVRFLFAIIQNVTVDLSFSQFQSLLAHTKEEIANIFYMHEPQLFNGEKFGLKNYDSSSGVTYYKTDYFTHKVMSSLYLRLLQQNKIRPFSNIFQLAQYYPFTTFFGLNVLLFIENSKKIVLTKRSHKLLGMTQDLWHVSANEGIDLSDEKNNRVDLQRCTQRALYEELGITTQNFKTQLVNIFMTPRPLELGILTHVFLGQFTEEDVRQSFNKAKDSALESTGDDQTGLYFLPHNNNVIQNFVNTQQLTAVAQYVLSCIDS